MTPDQILRIRKALSENRTTFGARFGRSGRTVESWEQGNREPDPLVIRELQRIVKAKKLSVSTDSERG